MHFDQASRLRQAVRNSLRADDGHARRLPMAVVTGGRGGVGTSTVALGLAESLAICGHRVILVEADLDRGGIVKQQDDGPSIADCIAGRISVADALEPGPGGIWVLPGAWAPAEITQCTTTHQDRLIAELKSLTAQADLVVVDLGSNRNHFVRRFWRAASLIAVVTIPEAEAVMDSYAAIKVLVAGDTSLPVYTVVNFAEDDQQSLLVHERVRATCKRFLGLRTAPLGEVGRHETPCADFGTALVPLAESLCQELGIAGARQRTRAAA